jgi:HAD superfamily hydrolase (TIGR01484 family)
MRLRPLAELDPAICRRLQGVVFDIDDTITEDGRILEASYAALWRLREAGVSLVAVTGRPLGWCDVLAQLAPIDVAVGENGAGWAWRQGRKLLEGYWDDEPERERQRARIDALVQKVAVELPEIQLADDQTHRRIDVAFDVAETVQLPAATVNHLCGLIRDAGAQVLVSSVHAHAFYGNHDKATGVVRAVAEVLGHDVAGAPERWLFTGDSGNDAPAFSYFPVSVGVANVRAHLARLPVAPAYIASRPCGHGFAEIAATVLRARG